MGSYEQEPGKRIVYSDIGGRGAAVFNSGPSVAHSDPGVMQPTSPARAGRNPDARRPDSLQGLHHAKSGWGFGGEAPKEEKSCEAAPRPSSFLDELTINRNTPPGRGRHCGRFTIRGYDAVSGTTKFYRLN